MYRLDIQTNSIDNRPQIYRQTDAQYLHKSGVVHAVLQTPSSLSLQHSPSLTLLLYLQYHAHTNPPNLNSPSVAKERCTPPYNLQCYHQYDIPPSPHHAVSPTNISPSTPTPTLTRDIRCETTPKEIPSNAGQFLLCSRFGSCSSFSHHLVLPVVHPSASHHTLSIQPSIRTYTHPFKQ